MGRSAAPAGQLAALDHYDASSHNPFEQWGARFLVQSRGGHVFHTETRGGVALEEEVAFAIGSGTRGRSYVVDHAGVLAQSPVSWYSQEGRWAASPGLTPDRHFNRPVIALCLFCHVNDAEPVEGAVNRFRTPVRAHAIGCERCHGPGELHIARQRGAGGAAPDDTIVNPARLEPALREAVCQQCHLAGETRLLRRGRGAFDYRPGLPLHLFWAVFERPPGLGENKAVGQVEQMYESRCFRGSKGKLGCISCHDPHALPAAAERVAYYRGRCLSCHEDASCRLPRAERDKQNQNDCSACHMPRARTADIAHTAITDHRVLARPGSPPAAAPARWRPGDPMLVNFYRDLIPADDPGASRDLGVALSTLAQKNGGPAARPLGPMALPLLEAAVYRDPDDVDAREALGYVLWLHAWAPESRRAYEMVLERAPGRELSLHNVAAYAAAEGRGAAAVDAYRRLIDVNPANAGYRQELAEALEKAADWGGAASEARAALRLDPFQVAARQLLIRALLRSGRTQEAGVEWDALLSMKPNDIEALRRWYAEQTR
jgi:tetratricopeptide (TPR) repeat protein